MYYIIPMYIVSFRYNSLSESENSEFEVLDSLATERVYTVMLEGEFMASILCSRLHALVDIIIIDITLFPFPGLRMLVICRPTSRPGPWTVPLSTSGQGI